MAGNHTCRLVARITSRGRDYFHRAWYIKIIMVIVILCSQKLSRSENLLGAPFPGSLDFDLQACLTFHCSSAANAILPAGQSITTNQILEYQRTWHAIFDKVLKGGGAKSF